jgi:hypothetical protein
MWLISTSLVENERVMTVETQLYLGKFLKTTTRFGPELSGPITRLKQEITEKFSQI